MFRLIHHRIVVPHWTVKTQFNFRGLSGDIFLYGFGHEFLFFYDI